MRGHQRRRIVQTVTYHEDLSARGFKRRDVRHLSGGQYGSEVRNAELPCDQRYRGLTIAGSRLDQNAGVLEFGDRLRRIRSQEILEAELGQPASVFGKND